MSRKRGNGEGSISRRKGGGWMAQYVVYTAEGRKRRTLYGKTRQEVAGKLAKALSDRGDGLIFNAGKMKVGEYLERWLRDSVEGNVRPRTLSNYRLQARRHIAPALGELKLKGLTPAHVQGLYRQKLDAGLYPASVRSVHAVLHRALKQALRWGLVPRNVTEAVDVPKLVHEEVRALSPEEARVFLEAARGDRYECMYVVAVTVGLRRGEVLDLKWDGRGPRGRDATSRQAAAEDARRVGAQIYCPEGRQRAHRQPPPAYRRGPARPQAAPGAGEA